MSAEPDDQTPARVPSWRSRLLRTAAVLAGVLAVLGLAPSVAAAADPTECPTGYNGSPDDPDGCVPMTTVETLEALARAYYDTRAQITESEQRYAAIDQQLKEAQAGLATLRSTISKVAAARFMSGSVGVVSSVLNGEAPSQELLAGAGVNEYLLWRDDNYIREYREIEATTQAQQEQLAEELEFQRAQRESLQQQVRDAELKLADEGGTDAPTGVLEGISDAAIPAERNADGGFDPEAKTVNDPTTGGLITPRTLHMLEQAKLAGFTRYVACYRAGDQYEHPKGRACDFAVNVNGFGGAAPVGGDDYNYGSRLASWAVDNADALGVMYVIWYLRIWTPARGWHAYSGGLGDPSSNHQNHVHISML